MNDKRDQLYDNLINSGRVSEDEIGNREQFKAAISDEATSRQFYKNIINSGALTPDEIGSEDDFYGSISSDFAAPEQKQGYQPSAEDMAGFMGTINRAGNVVSGTMQNYDRRSQNLQKRQGLNVPQRVNIGESNNLVQGDQRINSETGQLENTYITSSGNEYDNKALADMEQRQQDQYDRDRRYMESLPGELENAYAERDRISKEMKKYSAPPADYMPMQNTGGWSMPAAFTKNNPKYLELEAALHKVNERITTLEAERDDNGDTQFWRGVWDVISNPVNFSTGDIARDAVALYGLNKKINSGQPLNKEAQMFAEATINAERAEANFGKNRGTMYEFGSIFGHSIPFMLDIASTGGMGGLSSLGVKGGAKLGGKLAERYASSALGKAILKNLGKRADKISQGIIKGTAYAGGLEASGLLMANTVGAGNTAADILNRNLGHLRIGSDGLYYFEGGEDFGSAFLKGQASQSFEYASEMLGEKLDLLPKFINGAIARTLEKHGTNQTLDFIRRIANNKYVKAGKEFLNFTGVQGTFAEGMEEEANMVLNAIFTGDNTWFKNDENKDAVFDLNTQLKLWGSMALTSAVLRTPYYIASGTQAAGYYGYKHANDAANAKASAVFGENNWQMIKEEIDNSDNDYLPTLLESVITGDMSQEQKEATMYYADSLLKMRGYNLATVDNTVKQAEEGDSDDISQNLNQNYVQGHENQDPDLMKQFADEANEAQKALPQYGQEFAKMVRESQDPVSTLNDLMNKRDIYSDKQIAAAADYFQKMSRVGGAMDGALDRIDLEVERANAEVRANTHQQTGNVIMATDTGANNNYYVIGGDIVTDPEIGITSVVGTGGAVVVKDALTGEVSVKSPQEIAFYSLQPADTLIQQNETVLRQQLMQEADDNFTFGSPANEVYQLEDTVALNDGEGNIIEGQIGMMPNSVDGVYVVYTPDNKALQFTADQLNRMIVTHNGQEVQRANTGAPSDNQQVTDGTQPIIQTSGNEIGLNQVNNSQENNQKPFDNGQSAENISNQPQPAQSGETAGGEASAENGTGANEPPVSALSRIPILTDDKGQPVLKKGRPQYQWHKASVDDAAAALIETTGGDMVMARDTASDLIKNAEDGLEKIRKQKPKGEDPIEIAESRMDIKRQENEQQAIIKQWKDVNQAIQKQMRDEAAARQAEIEAAKSEEQRQREAEEARIRKEKQDEADRQRLREAIERDREKMNKEYAPVVEARKEMADNPESQDILSNIEPQSLEEWVSSLILPHSMLWQDASESEIGLQSELGLKRADMQRMMNLLGTKESGAKPFGKMVLDIYEGLPDAMKDQYTDEDVRRTLLDLFNEGSSTRMMHLTEENRIAQAREAYQENLRREAEAEMDAWCEAYHLTPEERETFEDFMSQAPIEPEQEIINNIIADNEQNQASPAVGKQPVNRRNAAGIEGGKSQVQQAAQATDNGNTEQRTGSGTEEASDQPSVVNDNVPGTESIFVTPVLDIEKSRQLVSNLSNAYTSGNQAAIQSAAASMKAYVDNGGDFENKESDEYFDYEGDDPESLALQYKQRILLDRYLDEDKDQEYIKTGLKPDMRDQQAKETFPIREQSSPKVGTSQSQGGNEEPVTVEPSEQLKPTDLRDAVRVESPEIGVAEANTRARESSGIKPVGSGNFGPIYDQFRGKPKEAIDFLTKNKDGEALGALSHKDIGEIDLVWGEEGTGHSDGYGLAKLVKYHPEVLENLQEILDEMEVVNRTDNRINLESDKYKAAIRLTWNEQSKTWLLTIFEKKNSALDNTTDTGKTSNRGKRNDTATPQSTVSQGKDTKNPANLQEKTEKSSQESAKEPKRLVSDEKMEKIRKQIRSKLNNLNAGIDPEMMLLGAMYAVGNIERGVTKFADYAKKMVTDLGDKIRPYLKSFYNAVRDMPEAQEYVSQMDDYQTVSSFDVYNFDKQQAPDTFTKAEQVVTEKRINSKANKIKEMDLFAGDLFGNQEKTKIIKKTVKKTTQNQKPEETKTKRKPQLSDFDSLASGKRFVTPDGTIEIARVDYDTLQVWDIDADGNRSNRTRTVDTVDIADGLTAGTVTEVDYSASKSEPRLRTATEADLDSNDAKWYHNGKRVYIMLITRSGEQISATQFSKPTVESVMLTNGKSVKLEDLMVEDDSAIGATSTPSQVAAEEAKVDTNPTEAQKEAGNYQKGHIKIDGYDITIENPKGSIRRGTDANGKPWETEMHNTYGYIRGTEGVDGDHIDVFLSDNPTNGSVYVVDQINPSTNEFDEHKVMYGFSSEAEAREAYLANYSKGWKGLGNITEVSREDFKKWIESSHRKTKPFAEYKSVKSQKKRSDWWNDPNRPQSIDPKDYKTYMTPEAKEYFAKFKGGETDFTKWAHPNLAYITAAVWDEVEIPYEELKNVPEIVEAENTVKNAESKGKLVITDEEANSLAQRLIDREQARQERKALVIIGLPAGGKSSVFANPLAKEFGARIIDSDDVKPWLDGFDGCNGAGYVQDASAEVAEKAIDIAVNNGDNIIIPRIGGNSVIELSAALRLAGYDVQLYFNDVKGVTSIDRAASRFALSGRYLSLDYLTKKAGVPSENFSKFAEKTLGGYLDECDQTEVQNIRKRLQRLRGELYESGSGLWESLAAKREGAGTTEGTVQTDLGSRGQQSGANEVSVLLNEPLFNYSEWKSNDVPYGEKPKEIWNSESGKPMPGKKEEKSNETEQKVSGKPESTGEGTEQASGSAGRTGAEPGTESNRTQRTGSGSSVETQQPATPKQAPKHNNRRNNVGERGQDYAPTSPKARFNANVEAIKLMRLLNDEGIEAPTKDQMEVLRKYSGWGGMGTYFNDESSAENKQLRDLLTDEEYNDAALSIKTAYYTPAYIIDTLWDIAKTMGFKGGNILEGSAGIGNIIGQMPKDISSRSDIEAVEIDSISGNILKLLYPDAKVHIQGFQDTIIQNGTVDLAITNVPFAADLSVIDKVDKDLSRQFRQLHDFCIAKNIRKLREGGIGIFISTSGTLDKSTKLREWITDAGQADVVGAFRLNNKTFGGATVTSDIIVVRKRTKGQKSPVAIDIVKASPLRVGTWTDKYGNDHQVSLVVNDYFRDHPEMMAGEMAFAYEKGETFRPGSYALYPKEGMSQEKMLADFAKGMSKAKEVTAPKQQTEEVQNQLTAEKEGRMLVDKNGRLCVSERGIAVPLGLNDQKVKGYTKAECFTDYQAVQKAVDDVLQQQLNDPDDAALKPKLDELNKAYDKFTKRYGTLHKNTAISFLRNDIDFPSFQALENYSETKDMKGKVTVKTAKTPLFSQRVLGFKTEPKPETIRDAVISSIFRTNNIDLGWIADKLGKSEDDVRNEILSDRLAFEDPSTGNLEIRYKYLSGNVREKLSIAESYNTDGKYSANVEELRKAVPMDIPSHLIDFSLGSSWIPIELYKDYLKETLNLDNVKLSHVEGTWVLNEGFSYRNEKNRSAGVYSEKFRETIYGHQLVAAALNNRPVKVSKQVSEGYGDNKTTKTVVDQAATQACAVRVDEIKDEFKQWAKKRMQDDPELSQRIEKIYNDKFNALVPMQINEEFLPERFEGANKNISLYDHQKRGVMRGLTSPTMLAHEVGTGKSFTLISTAMEMRRLGTAKKPMIVVQNATVAQMTSDAKLLYPNAKVLSLSEKDRSAEGRRAFYAKIKYNDWDLIIVPQSTFERIPDSPERELQFIQEKIDEKKHVIEAAEAAGMDERELSRLKRELEKIEQEYGDTYLDHDPTNNLVYDPKYGGYKEKSDKKKKKDAKREAASLDKAETKAKEMLDRAVDDVQYFDDLGVDALLVDEAHEYKHLGFQTSIGRGIKGIDPSYSKKCAGLYNKTRSVFEKAGWKNVVFATGTPISNTAAEIWTFMKYLMPADVMKQNDIYYFDDFVHNFGNISQMLEFATSGKFKENTRFAAYVNKPELIRIWSQVADTVRTEEVGEVKSKVPEKEGGKDQDVFLPQSPSLISIMSAVRAELERFENMEGKQKKENSHIPLTMYGIAKRAAIDPRLVNPDAPDEPLSKTNAAVKEIVKDLNNTKSYKGTVAVFCDNQNRKGNDGSIEFNIYDDMREKLIAQGVPADQIAIIRSGMSIVAKQKVFDAVNSGAIRVVLGSTQTLGTGVNMQERLHLLIHMDAPDRPMDYTQRNGRIERQGNLHKVWGKPIRIVRFGVEDSLDVTAYQRLKTKSGFIDSIMDGKAALLNNQVDRTVEEEEEGLFDNPVAVLSGSQYALKKNQAERELRKYQGKKAQWEADQVYITNTLRHNKSVLSSTEENIKEEENRLANIKKLFPDGKVKTITVEGVKIDMTKDDGAKKLGEAIKEKINDPVNATVKKLRENQIYNDESQQYTIELDGHPVNFTVSIYRTSEWDSGKMRTIIHKGTEYSSPDLHSYSSMTARSVRDYLDEILEQVVTGIDYQDRIDAYRAKIERINSENEQMRQREGQPFQFDKELETAKKNVEEYTELMKQEMQEKEAKYAQQQKEAEENGNTFDLGKAEENGDDDDVLRRSDEDYDEPIFYSNAMMAVESIQQDKATPEQWLAMISKAGGLKAGEDKWLGLSDWLNSQKDKKSITKQEVMDYIRQNQIQIEEVKYGDQKDLMNDEMEKRMPGWKDAFRINPFYDEFEIIVVDDKKALDLFNANVDESDRHELENGRLNNYDRSDVKSWAEDMVSMTPFPNDVKRIDSTREQYTTNGLEDRKEIALTVPTVEPYNQGDKIHFGDAGEGRAVAWIRFGDTTDADGNKVLVIDEIQSKRHQDGRENGYEGQVAPEIIQELKKLEQNYLTAYKTYDDYLESLRYKYKVVDTRKIRTNEENQKVQQLYEAQFQSELSLNSFKSHNKLGAFSVRVPDAPFEKNWHELAMKRMLRYAAENGYDKIAWTTGEQQAERYSLGNTFNYVSYNKDSHKLMAANIVDGVIDYDLPSIEEKVVPEKLADYVGKETALRLMEKGSLSGNDLRIGGEGMKGFYDQMLPRFMDKYGKKWGVKTGGINLPDLGDQSYKLNKDGKMQKGLTMWSIDVTPEMKESVMQGQPMFREMEVFSEGQTFPIHTSEVFSSYNVLGKRLSYSTDLMPDEYPTQQSLLNALRNQYTEYYVTLENNNVVMQSFNSVMAEANNAQTAKKAKGTKSYVERKTRRAINAVQDMAKKMGLDVEVLTSKEGLSEKDANAKGLFNKRTHKITIILPNHVTQSDVINTLLHEGVAHYGLRKMFGNAFYTFLDNVYNNVDPNLKARIDAAMKRNAWDRYTATEEYLARLAERTDFKHATSSGWWQKIKDFFISMLAKAGFNTTLTDNELRYILWRSYDNLLHPDSRRTIFDKAREVDMMNRLKVGRYKERVPVRITAETIPGVADHVNEEMLNRDLENIPSQELLLSLSQKEGDERNEAIDELAKRVGSGEARIVRLGEEMERGRRTLCHRVGSVLGSQFFAESEISDGTMGTGMHQRTLETKGQAAKEELQVKSDILSWAKRNGYYIDEKDVEKDSLDGKVFRSAAESNVYRTKDGKKVIKFMIVSDYYRHGLLKRLDDLALQNALLSDPVEVIGFSENKYGGLNVVLQQNYIEGDTVLERFNGDTDQSNDYIDAYLTTVLGLREWYDEYGEFEGTFTKKGILYKDIHGGNVIIDKNGNRHIIDCQVEYKNDRFPSERMPGFSVDDNNHNKDNDILHRSDDDWGDDEVYVEPFEENYDIARATYEEAAASEALKFQEAWQDKMASLKVLQNAIEKETGKKATGAEDAYLYENRMHGKAKNQSENYDRRFYQPVLKAADKMMKAKGWTEIRDLTDYMVAKHGLERNIFYAFKAAVTGMVRDNIIKEQKKLSKRYERGEIDALTYKKEQKELEKRLDKDVAEKLMEVHNDPEHIRMKEDYEAGRITYADYITNEENLRRTYAPDFDEYYKDYSGLTELTGDENDYMTSALAMVDAAERDAQQEVTDLWNAVNAATKETLRFAYESGTMSRNTYNNVRAMFEYYIPLRGWEENNADDFYDYVSERNVFSTAIKKAYGRKSLAENPIAYIGNMAVSTLLAGHRNQLKQHFLNYVMNNPTSLVSVSEKWFENKGTETSPYWVEVAPEIPANATADQIADIVEAFNEEMKQKAAEGKATTTRGSLQIAYHATGAEKNEHMVEVQRAGKTYQLYINGNPKAAQALNGINEKAVRRISQTDFGKLIESVNRSMAAFFTSKNPAFVISNLSRDLTMAGASVAIKEDAAYNAQFIKNVVKVLRPRTGRGGKFGFARMIAGPKAIGFTGMIPSLMRKYLDGDLDITNETERLFGEFMDEGGETGFVNMLSVDSFKDKMQKEIARMQGTTLNIAKARQGTKETPVGKGLRMMGDIFEFYNRCAEDATRFIVYMTSRQTGKSLEDSIADAKDVTLNFNRKGTGSKWNAVVRDLFIFVNPAIQALSNMFKMAYKHPLKFTAVTAAFVAGGALMPIINQWLLNMFGDDDDKDAYWNLPPWVRKNNLVMWIPGTKNFITIPLAQEFRVFYGLGEMASSLTYDHPVHQWPMEILSSFMDLIPINPTGNGGNLAVDLTPTMLQPLMQLHDNVDFTGKPIWKENQGNKYAPMYKKAYISTPEWMVSLSEAVNDITGGNEGKKGWIEENLYGGDYINNPAVWNHILQGYFGGMYNTIAKGFDVGVTAAKGEMPKVYQTPVLNRFLNRPVERDNAGVLGEEYYKLTEERDRLKYELRTWQKKAADGEEGAQDHVDEILSSDEYQRIMVIDHYDKIMKDLKAGEKAATNYTDKTTIKESITLYKAEMMEELAAIDGGEDPLEAAKRKFEEATTVAERNRLRLRIEKLIQREGENRKNRGGEVEKALSYHEDDDREIRKVNDRYQELATSKMIADDARIRKAKQEIKQHTDEFKRLIASGAGDQAADYRRKHQKWFRADDIIQSQSRTMNANKKLLGKGHDDAIMKLIDANRNRMLKVIEELE